MKVPRPRWLLPGFLLLGVLVLAVLHRPVRRPVSDTRFQMDTVVTVSLWGVAEEDAQPLFARAFAAIGAVDREMARIPGTPLWALNQAGSGPLPEATAEVLEEALDWSRRTAGAFDPTTAPLLDLWDVMAGPHPPPDPAALRAVLGRVGWERVRFDPAADYVHLGGTALDLGGIAKGYALDRAAQALRDAGAESFIVNAGGDLFVSGSKGGRPWRVGIQHPRRPDGFLRVVEPGEGALVTSGDYERSYEWDGVRVHHILDPRTGQPAGRCRSVTVWAPRAVDADALATAVFVLGPQDGMALVAGHPRAEVMLVDDAGAVHESPGFDAVAVEVPRQ